MIEERVLVQKFLNRKQRERLKKPEWLKIKLGDPRNQNAVLDLISGLNLHTVCQEAKCPNIFECWTDKTATFMLGGDTCTRHCGFCAVNKGKPMDLDPSCVLGITSVDIPPGGEPWELGLIARSDGLDRLHGLGRYAPGGECADVPDWFRALVLRSDAMNRAGGLGPYAR